MPGALKTRGYADEGMTQLTQAYPGAHPVRIPWVIIRPADSSPIAPAGDREHARRRPSATNTAHAHGMLDKYSEFHGTWTQGNRAANARHIPIARELNEVQLRPLDVIHRSDRMHKAVVYQALQSRVLAGSGCPGPRTDQ